MVDDVSDEVGTTGTVVEDVTTDVATLATFFVVDVVAAAAEDVVVDTTAVAAVVDVLSRDSSAATRSVNLFTASSSFSNILAEPTEANADTIVE